MSRWQDDLGRELREAPIPSHRPDHFERVRERIRKLDGQTMTPVTESTPTPQWPLAPRVRRQPVPAPRRKRPLVRLAAAGSVAAALIAAVAVTWMGLPGVDRTEPATATADTVLTSVQHALSGLSSIQGDVVDYGTARGRPYSRRVGSFVFTSDGDYRIVELENGTTSTYDARTRIARRYYDRDGSASTGEIARNLPDPGPFFSPWMGVPPVLDRSIAAYARAVIAELDPDVPVTPVTWEGRTGWSITVPEKLNGDGASHGSTRIIVDAASGYPLSVEHWSPDGEVSGTRIEHVQVSDEVSRGLFTLRPELDRRLLPTSERFQRLTVSQASALAARAGGVSKTARGKRGRIQQISGFAPLVPSWVPNGYKLTGITGAVNGSYLGTTNPVALDDVAALTLVFSYSRGFDRFCVISRWRKYDRSGTADPFDENSALQSTSTLAPLNAGCLRGSTARVVLGLQDWPHLFVTSGKGNHVSLSVAGDLTRAELVAVADSLRPAGR